MGVLFQIETARLLVATTSACCETRHVGFRGNEESSSSACGSCGNRAAISKALWAGLDVHRAGSFHGLSGQLKHHAVVHATAPSEVTQHSETTLDPYRTAK